MRTLQTGVTAAVLWLQFVVACSPEGRSLAEAAPRGGSGSSAGAAGTDSAMAGSESSVSEATAGSTGAPTQMDAGGEPDCAEEECPVTCGAADECPEGRTCDLSSGQCVHCEGAECEGTPECSESIACEEGLVCNLAASKCVECLDADDCDEGQTCDANVCTDPPVKCDPSVVVLVQRSGAMFGGEDWFGAVDEALTEGDQPLAMQYANRVDLQVAAFYRETTNEGQVCPLFHESGPRAVFEDLNDVFDNGRASYQSTPYKTDAPTPEALLAMPSRLGDNAQRYVLLVHTNVPDSCGPVDNPCSIDPAIAAAQSVYQEGVRTLVLALGDSTAYDTAQTGDQGFELYQQSLANAGMGQPVQGPHPVTAGCGDATAQYVNDGAGSATWYRAQSGEQLRGHLQTMLERAATCQ